jgi:cyclophilin family peptidyl-prolyl cis-trans isomerase
MNRLHLGLACAAFAALVLTLAPAPTGAQSKPAPTDAQSKTEDPALKAIDDFIAKQKIDKSGSGWKESLPAPPKVESWDASKRYLWDLETSLGKIVVQLMPDVAPMHVTSTVYLTKLGFYDGVVFHRVISGFMAQGGDPTGSGRGGPGYQYGGEFSNKVKHDKPGMLSMANSGPGTDGSQFFLTFVPTPHLDGKHTIFGEVVGGNNTLKKLEEKGSSSGRTSETLKIDRASIRVE